MQGFARQNGENPNDVLKKKKKLLNYSNVCKNTDLFFLRVLMVTAEHLSFQILSQISIRTLIETRFLEDKSHKSSRNTVNEIWICSGDQEGFKYKLWIQQKFRVL